MLSLRSPGIRSRIVLLSALLLIGVAIYWAFFLREHHRWSEDLKLWDGKVLHVQQHMSRQAYHGLVGHGSPFWWGGGDRWYDMTLSVGDRHFHWKSPHTPIAIQVDEDGTVYIVVLDRESERRANVHGPVFRFYRSRGNGSWGEIASKDFPRHLAIQNRECGYYSDGSDDDRTNILGVIERMDPAEAEFLSSLNGDLWVFLEDPDGKTLERFPSEKFARDFKAKWIRPIRPGK